MPSIINATTTNGVAISPDNSGSLQLATNNGTTAVTIDTSQNLLVGTNTQVAGAKLTLSGSATLGSTYQQVITDGTRAVRLGANSTSAEIQSTGGVPLYLNYGGNDVVIVPQGSGNVGIGTSSPSFPLQVSSGTSGNISFMVNPPGLTNFAVIPSNSGSTGTRIGTTGGDTFAFITNNTERMRITSGGDVLIAKTAADDTTVGFRYVPDGYLSLVRNSNPPLYLNRLSSDGRIQEFARSNTIVGNISVTTTATSYNTSSDYRLKENIAPMTGALGVVQQLKPVTYTWKADGSSGQGFIAHELQAVVPECVVGEKDAVELVDIKDEEGNVIGQEEKPIYQGVDTSFLVATLTAAIQELKAELDTVKAELASTNLSLADAKAELNTLKNPPVEGTK